ncbi:uncharacterized protein PRCAT00002596001 [Priceomyces carsonii]|uniref:uncharacterized protein n=1 Tax=Priceomyces carsonii TaxID=28549 RepID=UPI002ED8EF14|nr:unnamed protein product [Priceomyces carsonii]
MEYTLNLAAERSVVRESLKGIIWTIFFHRLFGPIVPSTNEFLNVTYPMADDQPDLDSLMDEKISYLIKNEFNVLETEKTSHVIIQFLDKRVTKSKKKSSWFGQGKLENAEDLKLWESWIIVVRCLPLEDESRSSPSSLSSSTNGHILATHNSNEKTNTDISIESFESNLLKIIDIVDTHKDHIPPITSLESSPFPYTIEVERRAPNRTYLTNDDESWGKYIKKMLD